jgi:hypothetical protein
MSTAPHLADATQRSGATRREPSTRDIWQVPIIGWLAFAFIWAQQSRWTYLIRERPSPPFIELLLHALAFAGAWLLLTPVPVLAARAGQRQSVAIARVGIHAALALTTAAVHVVAFGLLYGLVPHSARIPIASPLNISLFASDLLIYVVLAAWASGRQYDVWGEQRAITSARLSAELAHVRWRARAVQLDPPLLMAALARIEQLVLVSPMASERAIMQLGDFLRATLDEATPPETLQREAGALRASVEQALTEGG